MGVNMHGVCVMKAWAWNLSWKQQAVLLSALRGCDTADKHDISKPFIRRLRGVVLHNGATDDAEFMSANISEKDIHDFTKALDKYPIHFILHLVHTAKVIGYNHPDPDERA